MARNQKGLIVGALIVLVLLLMGGKKPPGVPAAPSGSIEGAVTLSQETYAARAHRVPKRIGDTVTISVSWTAATKNFQGQPIAWNYGISWWYINLPTGEVFKGGFFNIGNRPNGSFSFGASDVLDAVFFPGNWSVQVALHADNSSPSGLPLNDMPLLENDALLLATGAHNNAFQVV